MLEVNLQYEDFKRQAQRLVGAESQMAYAISLALNRANENARLALIQQTWPRSIDQRNPNYIRLALQRGPPALKNDLRVSIVDAMADRVLANLQMHATGGTKTPRKVARLAVPIQANVKRTQSGTTKSQRPANLINSFVADRTGRGPAIYQRGSDGKLRMMYVLKSSVPIPKQVNFYEDYADTMRRDAKANFPAAMMTALITSNK
jgi:hypothetical protein